MAKKGYRNFERLSLLLIHKVQKPASASKIIREDALLLSCIMACTVVDGLGKPIIARFFRRVQTDLT